MSKRSHISFTIAAFVAMHSIAVATDKNTATQYANDAVDSMQQEYDASSKLVKAGEMSAADLQRKAEALFEARLLLLTLQHDDAGITTILRDKTKKCDEHFARLTAVRSGIPTQQVDLAQLRSLQARMQYATHVGDTPMADATLNEAIAIEEDKLANTKRLVKQGTVGRAAVAKQQLRLARLIAHREISLPQSSEH